MDFPFSFEEHGGFNWQELDHLSLNAQEITDFSVNSNPFGPPPSVLKALQDVDISVYPDKDCLNLRKLLSRQNHLQIENVLIGNGTTELIWLIAKAFIKPKDVVLIIGPTFSEYRRVSESQGAEIIEICASPPLFQIPINKAIEVNHSIAIRMVFLCNPNNPTGQSLKKDQIRELFSSLSDACILVIDEAYQSFLEDFSFNDDLDNFNHDRVIHLRSMTKDFALAGLRIGYAQAASSIIHRIKQFQPTWSVNAFAQAAGCAAVHEKKYYQGTLERLRKLKKEFFSGIQDLGYSVVLSDVHFGLIRVNKSAKVLRMELLKQSLLVRDCTSFGLPQFIRVSTRLPRENIELLHALSDLNE